MTTKEKLKKAEAEKDKLQSKIDKLKKQYIIEHCPFKVGDRVYYSQWSEEPRPGKIKWIAYDRELGFYFNIERMNKGHKERTGRPQYVSIKPGRWKEDVIKAAQ